MSPPLRKETVQLSAEYRSWGRVITPQQRLIEPVWTGALSLPEDSSVLPYGQGRSYGDCCLNDGGSIISTRWLDRILAFDRENGIIRCEAGLTLVNLIKFIVPHGWFPPVTPGTQFISIGGAIANDVHGKNHHGSGTFGHHLRSFELLRSNGERIVCSRDSNSDLFRATIAGIGLTGFVTWAEFSLRKITSSAIDVESIKFSNLEEFFEVSESSSRDFEYTVAWLDCVASGKNFGRGLFMRGNHAASGPLAVSGGSLAVVPFDAPNFVLGSASIRAFNTAYYHKQREKIKRFTSSYRPFFYPLDSVLHWNRLYGKRGFYQFQCVVPAERGHEPTRRILEAIVASGKASFLAVMKEFGDCEPAGLLSFPRRGVTLALDFANEGSTTERLLRDLDDLTAKLGGALYPAKDGLMTPENFRRYYPKLNEFQQFKDPKFSSSLWRRLMESS